MTTQTLAAALMIRALGNEADIMITTSHVDFMKDTIDTEAMDLARYMAGPKAVNFAHDHGRLPVAQTVALARSPSGIRARFRWLTEANPEAVAVRRVFEQGALGASVEFVPIEMSPNRSGGMHFAKSILTGWALTANPANPECVRMMKSLGLDHNAPVLYLTDDESDAPVLVLRDDADDDRVTFEPRDLVAAFQTVIGARVQAEVARQTQGWPGLAPSPSVLVRDDAGATWRVDAATLTAAWAEVLGAEVTRGVRSAVNQLTGRLDD